MTDKKKTEETITLEDISSAVKKLTLPLVIKIDGGL